MEEQPDKQERNDKVASQTTVSVNSSESETSQTPNGEVLNNESAKQYNPKSNKRKIIIIIVCIILVLLFAAALYKFQEEDATNDSGVDTTQAASADEDVVDQPVRKIYFAEGSDWGKLTLYSIEPYSKELEKIDDGLRAGSGAAGAGSDSPLNSPDFLKVAYIKGDNIWLAGEELAPQKIDQHDVVSSETGFYTHYLSAWSSDSARLVYVIRFSCPIHSSNECSPSDENEEISGVYMYDYSTKATAKLPIKSVEQWIPGTSKIVYFETNPDTLNNEYMRTYDVDSETDERLSASPFDFGVQDSFSDNGSRLIYSQGVNGSDGSEIVIANPDNTNQTVLHSGEWTGLQWPMFQKDSTTNYAFVKGVNELCSDGISGCPKSRLVIVQNSEEKLIGDVRGGPIGVFDSYYVVLTGSSVYSYNEPTEVSINLENFTTARKDSSIYSANFESAEDGDIFLGISNF